jgi:hypothetical protein
MIEPWLTLPMPPSGRSPWRNAVPLAPAQPGPLQPQRRSGTIGRSLCPLEGKVIRRRDVPGRPIIIAPVANKALKGVCQLGCGAQVHPEGGERNLHSSLRQVASFLCVRSLGDNTLPRTHFPVGLDGRQVCWRSRLDASAPLPESVRLALQLEPAWFLEVSVRKLFSRN